MMRFIENHDEFAMMLLHLRSLRSPAQIFQLPLHAFGQRKSCGWRPLMVGCWRSSWDTEAMHCSPFASSPPYTLSETRYHER